MGTDPWTEDILCDSGCRQPPNMAHLSHNLDSDTPPPLEIPALQNSTEGTQPHVLVHLITISDDGAFLALGGRDTPRPLRTIIASRVKLDQDNTIGPGSTSTNPCPEPFETPYRGRISRIARARSFRMYASGSDIRCLHQGAQPAVLGLPTATSFVTSREAQRLPTTLIKAAKHTPTAQQPVQAGTSLGSSFIRRPP